MVPRHVPWEGGATVLEYRWRTLHRYRAGGGIEVWRVEGRAAGIVLLRAQWGDRRRGFRQIQPGKITLPAGKPAPRAGLLSVRGGNEKTVTNCDHLPGHGLGCDRYYHYRHDHGGGGGPDEVTHRGRGRGRRRNHHC